MCSDFAAYSHAYSFQFSAHFALQNAVYPLCINRMGRCYPIPVLSSRNGTSKTRYLCIGQGLCPCLLVLLRRIVAHPYHPIRSTIYLTNRPNFNLTIDTNSNLCYDTNREYFPACCLNWQFDHLVYTVERSKSDESV